MFNKENFSNFVSKSEKYKETEQMSYIEKETREEIMNFQEEKKKLLDQMHNLLKKADNGEEISFIEKGFTEEIIGTPKGELKVRPYKGKPEKITHGDVAVGPMWGRDIKLHTSVRRKTKKEFILRETKRKIQDLWDKQLTLGVKDSRETSHIKSVEGLEESHQFDEQGQYEKIRPGHMAEKMVSSFFTKLLVNHPELPFTLEQGDVFDDALEKMDYIVHIKKEYTRGLQVESCEENDCEQQNHLGIQYTMNDSQEKQEEKQGQIEKAKTRNKDRVDDILLVTVPLDSIRNAIVKWRDHQKDKDNFSGPERFLSIDDKRDLFQGILKQLPNSLQIDPEEHWEKIKKQV